MLRETQTLRAGCSKAEPKILPRRRPPSGGTGRPKFNQLEMVITFTYKPSLVRIDACNFELSRNRPTNTNTQCHTPTQTNKQTGPITIHCTAASLARSVMMADFQNSFTIRLSLRFVKQSSMSQTACLQLVVLACFYESIRNVKDR